MRDSSEDELDRLMTQLSSGDRDAFDPLFRALYPRAVRLARTKLPDDQADDAAQSILVKVFARAGEFHAGRAVLPWFYAVAANELRTHERRRRRLRVRATGDAVIAHVSAADDPERLVLERELHECLARAILLLDDASAEVIRSMLDETRDTAMSPTAFRKRVSRAYAALRHLLLRGSDAT